MTSRFDVVELARLESLERTYDLKCALSARGLEARVVDGRSVGWLGASHITYSVVVRSRDLVYARWIADSIGIDAWPDEVDEKRESRLDSAQSHRSLDLDLLASSGKRCSASPLQTLTIGPRSLYAFLTECPLASDAQESICLEGGTR